MKSIPAFSKKTTGGGIATGAKARSGFTDNVKTTKLDKPKPSLTWRLIIPVKSTLDPNQRKDQGPMPLNQFRQSRKVYTRSLERFSVSRVRHYHFRGHARWLALRTGAYHRPERQDAAFSFEELLSNMRRLSPPVAGCAEPRRPGLVGTGGLETLPVRRYKQNCADSSGSGQWSAHDIRNRADPTRPIDRAGTWIPSWAINAPRRSIMPRPGPGPRRASSALRMCAGRPAACLATTTSWSGSRTPRGASTRLWISVSTCARSTTINEGKPSVTDTSSEEPPFAPAGKPYG